MSDTRRSWIWCALLLISIAFPGANARAQSNIVTPTWHFEDYSLNPYGQKTVIIYPLTAISTDTSNGVNRLVLGDPRRGVTTNSSFSTNLLNGSYYRVELWSGYYTYAFTNFFDTNVTGAVDGGDPIYRAFSTNLDRGTYAYSQQESLALFMLKTMAPAAGYVLTATDTNGGFSWQPSTGGGTNNYQSQAGNNLITLSTNTSSHVYTFAGVAQTNANMQLWGQTSPNTYSDNFDLSGTGKSVATAATNDLAATYLGFFHTRELQITNASGQGARFEPGANDSISLYNAVGTLGDSGNLSLSNLTANGAVNSAGGVNADNMTVTNTSRLNGDVIVGGTLSGSGAGLINISANALSGVIPLANLPGYIVTNNLASGLFTNNGVVIYVTNNTPAVALPNGSICLETTGQPWVRTNSTWVALGGGGGGSGNVTGAASSTNLEVALFNGTTGKAIFGSGHLLSDFALTSVLASGSQNGLLGSSDWTIFNNKMDFTTTSNLILDMTTPLDGLATNNQVNLFAVDSNTNPVPVHLGSNMNFTTNGDGTLNLNSTATSGGGSATNLSLITSNDFVTDTNWIFADFTKLQTLNLLLETNASVMLTNVWNLTNFHGSDFQFSTWENTNATWEILAMQVAGGLIKTNGVWNRGTNANQLDEAIIRLDPTGTNAFITWSATNLQPVQSFTNSLATGGGGDGAFTYTFIAATNVAATGDTATTTPAIDTTGANLLIGVAAWSNTGTNAPAFSDSKGNTWIRSVQYDAFNPKITFWYCTNPVVGSSHTFTIAEQSGSGWGIHIYAFAKSSGTPTYDVEAPRGGTANWGSSTVSAGSYTPSTASDLMLSAITWDVPTTTTAIVNSSFTQPLAAVYGSAYYGLDSAYKTKTDNAAENPGWTGSPNSASDASAIGIAFK